MKLSTSMTIDCVAGTTVVEVSAVVPDDGQSELDAELMQAMASALTLLGQATRREQHRIAGDEAS